MQADLTELLTPDQWRALRLRVAVEWFERQEFWVRSSQQRDHDNALVVRIYAKQRRWNPAAELRVLGYPEVSIQDLLRRARLQEQWLSRDADRVEQGIVSVETGAESVT